jgi:hypothetical protein
MAKKSVLFGAGAVVLASAVYVGGVYYTGVKINEYLNGIENNETITKQINQYLPGAKVSCKVDDDSFFSEKGNFTIAFEDETLNIPFTINKGFGSANTVIDTAKFEEMIAKNDSIKFAPNTVKADLEFDSSVFSSKIKAHGALKADYLDNTKGALDSALNIDINSDEDVVSHLNIKNLQDGKSFSVKEIEMSGNMQGITDIKSFGNSSLIIKGFEAMPYKFDNLKLTSKAVNQTKEGDFDMNVTLSGDDLFGYLMNYDIDLTVSKFNTDVIEQLSQSADTDKSYQELFKSVNSLAINKLNGKVGKIVAFFTGIQNVDQFNLTSSGKFEWNLEEGMDSLKGMLTVKSDSNKNAEQFFVEGEDGSYESALSIENGRLMVNGKPFM